MENPTSIVFAEDNPQDVRLFKYALSQVEEDINLVHYENGRDFLTALPKLYAPSIACILLDLNMPFVNGFEVLEELKKHPDFKLVPIVIFTSTNSNEEKVKCYELGANAYVSKPLEIDELVEIVQHIIQFWVKTNARVS